MVELSSVLARKSLQLESSAFRGTGLPMAHTFEVRDNPDKHRFEIDLGDGTFAIAEYRLHPDHITLTHTAVPPEHGGQGLGTKLIRFALASARERGLKVVPVCPFFATYIRKHPEEQDLVAEPYREKLGLDAERNDPPDD
jgi:hypothetical protein